MNLYTSTFASWNTPLDASWHGRRATYINLPLRRLHMTQERLSKGFKRTWEAFLRQRGHKVHVPKGIASVLVSRNGDGKGYRWLLTVACGKSKTLNQAEMEDVKCHVRRACQLRQQAYVVARFEKPERKVIVTPADRVLRSKRILPRKGGIPWDD